MENEFSPSSESRLSRLSTTWTLLRQAHGDQSSVAAEAKLTLIERYENAVFRYLLGATKNRDVAEDLFQEFALRVMKGSFQNATPEKGRFRDYVRRTLINLVNDEHRLANRRRSLQSPELGSTPSVADSSPEEFDIQWREEVLSLVWKELKLYETRTGRPVYSVLQVKLNNPDAETPQLTQTFNQQLGTSHSEASFRKTLQRAREKFADQLLDEVSRTLGTSNLDSIADEVNDLGLLSYCKKSIRRRRGVAHR